MERELLEQFDKMDIEEILDIFDSQNEYGDSQEMEYLIWYFGIDVNAFDNPDDIDKEIHKRFEEMKKENAL